MLFLKYQCFIGAGGRLVATAQRASSSLVPLVRTDRAIAVVNDGYESLTILICLVVHNQIEFVAALNWSKVPIHPLVTNRLELELLRVQAALAQKSLVRVIDGRDRTSVVGGIIPHRVSDGAGGVVFDVVDSSANSA